jgi:hypothetical protein
LTTAPEEALRNGVDDRRAERFRQVKDGRRL